MKPAQAELVLNARAGLAEGPVWDPETERLVWVEIPGGIVHFLDPASGRDRGIEVGQIVGAVAPRASGGLVLAVHDGFGMLDAESEEFRLTAPVEQEQRNIRMNDGGCDPSGRFWAGTMKMDEVGEGKAALYRLDIDGAVTEVLDGVRVSNGIGWSPDGSHMYFVDTPTQSIDRFAFNADTGTLGERTSLVDIASAAGSPDGLAIDSDGCLWIAVWGSWTIRRYTPEGKLDAEVRLPVSTPSSCAFGGPNLDILYITTGSVSLNDKERAEQPWAGGIFACDVGVSGLPMAPYSG